MKTCDACGERATCECPHCKADSCNDCAPICEHDARQPRAPAAAVIEPECACIDGACEPQKNEGAYCWRSGQSIPPGYFSSPPGVQA